MPFYSILLPTKNRSHLVGYAIQSVLQQDFDDFEIVVCDNDDDADATRLVVLGFADDRIKYLRTGNLDMVSNWNYALSAAVGDNVTVLEDKMIFYPGALVEIKDKIEQSQSGVVVWSTDIFDDIQTPAKLVQFLPLGQSETTSDEILGLVTKDFFKYWGLLPRGLSCAIPRSIIVDIVRVSGSSFYEPMAPDFMSAIKILKYVDKILTVYKAYTLVVSAKNSNGYDAISGKDKTLKYYSGRKKVNLSDKYIPVKNTMIVVNSVVNDYRTIAARNGGDIRGYKIEHKDYMNMMSRDLLISSFAARRVLWDKETLLQLVRSDKKLVRNLWYIFSYFVNFSTAHFLKKLGIGAGNQKTKVSFIEGQSLDRIEVFLSGKTDLGIAKSFSMPRNLDT